MMPSTMRESTCAVSLIGSPRPSWISAVERNSALPPSCDVPTSKETRVRVEDLAKIIASVLPERQLCFCPLFCMALSLRAWERHW